MSYAGIGEAIGLSASAIRRYKPPSTEQPTQKEGSGQRNKTSRLTAVIVAFLGGECGAPEIPPKDREQVVQQALIRFSNERYDPLQFYLPAKASIAEVIKQTRPRMRDPWLVGYSADWLASILISMAPDRAQQILALDDAATKIDFNWSQIRWLYDKRARGTAERPKRPLQHSVPLLVPTGTTGCRQFLEDRPIDFRAGQEI